MSKKNFSHFIAQTITFHITVQCNSIFYGNILSRVYSRKMEKSRKLQGYDKDPQGACNGNFKMLGGSKANIPSVGGYGYFLELHVSENDLRTFTIYGLISLLLHARYKVRQG